MNPIDYVVSETERQSGTMREAVGMYSAYLLASSMDLFDITLSEAVIIEWVREINGAEGYRKVPAVFNQGRPAVSANLIPKTMKNLVDAINDPQVGLTPNHYTREFLEIHPFADGNGRVGSLLWNFLNKTLHDPEPMPYFFGEQ